MFLLLLLRIKNADMLILCISNAEELIIKFKGVGKLPT